MWNVDFLLDSFWILCLVLPVFDGCGTLWVHGGFGVSTLLGFEVSALSGLVPCADWCLAFWWGLVSARVLRIA